jgi:chromosome partitioning protein
MALIFSVINHKGGTGKTTTVLNLGAALATLRKKVLLVDLDAQCNLSTSLGINGQKNHIGTMLLGQSSPVETITHNNGLSLISSTEDLSDYINKIDNEPGRETLLKETLEKVKDHFDYIIIDCSPGMGTLSINSLVAADFYIVPMQAENFAFIGLDKILQIAEKVKKRMNPGLELAGIVFVRQSQKTRFSQAVISNITSNQVLKNKIFKSTIRQDISLMECSAFGKTVFEYLPDGRGALDYLDLAKEIISKYGKR